MNTRISPRPKNETPPVQTPFSSAPAQDLHTRLNQAKAKLGHAKAREGVLSTTIQRYDTRLRELEGQGYVAHAVRRVRAEREQSLFRTVVEKGQEPQTAQGALRVQRRQFSVERLSLPKGMVDLDPETERRANDESKRLATVYRLITPERLWRGKFTKPVGMVGEGTGFGARRVINGQPRSPHGGSDYSAPRGTPVVAANGGRVALVADFFFPGRLVIVDHGLGLYTLYFHLDTIVVAEAQRVERGQPLGTVGATGRATGPHLHFGAQMRAARVDPATLLGLGFLD